MLFINCIFSSDTIDQQNKIADLQHQNRKMTEENTKLRQQIDIQEDIVTVNNTEIDKLKKKIRRYLASSSSSSSSSWYV
jgi:hypothetical protein